MTNYKDIENKRKNWFSLNRKLMYSDLWLGEKFTRGQAWVDMIGLANYKDGFIRVRGNKLTVKRGQVGWSIIKLSERWAWSEGKIRRYLNELQTDGQIERQKSNVSSIITIVKYEEYQYDGCQNGEQTAGQTAGQTADRRRTTNKKKQSKQEENNKKTSKFTPPTIDEVKAHCSDKGIDLDAESFCAHYESNGWLVGKNKMKSWTAAITTWTKNANKFNPKPKKEKTAQEMEDDYYHQSPKEEEDLRDWMREMHERKLAEKKMGEEQ